MREKSSVAETKTLKSPHDLDVALLSEILRELTPYRVMRAHQTDSLDRLLAGELPHSSWYYDAWVVSTAYRILKSGKSQTEIERLLLATVHPENPDEMK